MPRRRTILLTLIALLLGALTTISLAWVFACTDPAPRPKVWKPNDPARGLYSQQQIRPTRGPVSHPIMGGLANGVSATVRISHARILARTFCHGPDYRPPLGTPGFSGPLPSSDPPDVLVPACIRALALPWLSGFEWPRGRDVDWREIQATGWPLVALASEYRRAPNFTYEHRFGIRLKTTPPSLASMESWIDRARYTLPLLPLWPNFSLDTLLFASLWLPLLLLPGKLRRALRKRRNHCPNCNYDLKATPQGHPCPECGQSSAQIHQSP